MFDAIFSSDDDDVIADAVSVWITGGYWEPPGSCVRYLTRRTEGDTPISPRLRQVSIHVIERIWRGELEVSGSGTVHLLNRLQVEMDDVVEEYVWVQLLVGAMCSPVGLGDLSSHYWCLLDKLTLGRDFSRTLGPCLKVMGSLEKAEIWEKLEVWMVVVWQSLDDDEPVSTMEDIARVTLKLLLRRASAPRRFEALCEQGSLRDKNIAKLRQICDQERTEQLSSESPLPL
jgi:hypothetical protein